MGKKLFFIIWFGIVIMLSIIFPDFNMNLNNLGSFIALSLILVFQGIIFWLYKKNEKNIYKKFLTDETKSSFIANQGISKSIKASLKRTSKLFTNDLVFFDVFSALFFILNERNLCISLNIAFSFKFSIVILNALIFSIISALLMALKLIMTVYGLRRFAISTMEAIKSEQQKGQ